MKNVNHKAQSTLELEKYLNRPQSKRMQVRSQTLDSGRTNLAAPRCFIREHLSMKDVRQDTGWTLQLTRSLASCTGSRRLARRGARSQAAGRESASDGLAQRATRHFGGQQP